MKSPIITGIIGLLLGGGIASGVFLYLMYQQDMRFQAALRAQGLKNLGDFVENLKDGLPIAGKGDNGADKKIDKKPQTDEEKAMALGKGLVEDLEKNRLTRIHRAFTEDYRKKLDRAALEAMVYTHSGSLQHLLGPDNGRRQYKGELTNAGKTYAFYFTDEDNIRRNLINVVFILAKEKDGEEWKVSEFELTSTPR